MIYKNLSMKKVKLRENPENRNFQLLILHSRTEAIKKDFMMKLKKRKENYYYSGFIVKKDIHYS